MEQDSRAFLIETFTDLRDDLKERMQNGGKGGPDPEQSGWELAIYEVLLAGLAQGGAFPDDEAVREYVIGLAMATDKENEYERVALEHQAFSELVGALTAHGETMPVREHRNQRARTAATVCRRVS